MRNAKLKEAFQDEIRKACPQCGTVRLMAYWDEELEYYIYLSDTDTEICNNCQFVINTTKC